MERVAAMPDASLYVNRDGRRADDCVDSHGGGAHLVVGGSLGIFLFAPDGQVGGTHVSMSSLRVRFSLLWSTHDWLLWGLRQEEWVTK